MRLIKSLALFLVLSLQICDVIAQETERKHSIRFSVPIFYLSNYEECLRADDGFSGNLVEFSMKFEYSYRISNIFTPFVYTSIGVHRAEVLAFIGDLNHEPGVSRAWDGTRTNYGSAPSLSYGIGGRMHIIQLFGDLPIARRLDPYISASVGGYTMFSTARARAGCAEFESKLEEKYSVLLPVAVSPKGTSVEQQSMLGLNLYLSKKFGLWGEFGYVSFRYYNGFRANYGLVFRF